MRNTPAQARRKMSRLNVIGVLAFGMMLVLPTTLRAEQNPQIAEQIAKTYGLDSFGQVEAIRYTWNVDSPMGKISRTWEWSPKTNTVSYDGKDKEGKPLKVTYQRSQVDSQADVVKKQVDPNFANDQYWLLLPFHIVWDGVSVTEDGTQKLPIGDGSADRIAVKYPSEGGYQPGDTWDLYVGKDKRIEEIVYHRGAPTPPPQLVMATYADYKKAGPLLFATDHRGTIDGKPFRLYFTDISVKMTGSDNWIKAE
jgi:hypothetical protein